MDPRRGSSPLYTHEAGMAINPPLASSQKRPALSEIQDPSTSKGPHPGSMFKFAPNKDLFSPPKKKAKSAEPDRFAGIATNVEDFETFSYPGKHGNNDDDVGGKDVATPHELEWLIASIPLEDRVKGAADMNESLMVFLL
jgi:hypothetical protein